MELEKVVGQILSGRPGEAVEHVMGILHRNYIDSPEDLKMARSDHLNLMGVPFFVSMRLLHMGYLADSPVESVTLWVPEPEEDSKVNFSQKVFKHINSESILHTFGNVCLYEVIMEAPLVVGDALCHPCSLKATYVVEFASQNLHLRVQNLEGFPRNQAVHMENAAAECAVQVLKSKGYSNVCRYCGKKEGDQFEVYAAAVSDEATLIVECKNILNESSLEKLERTSSLVKKAPHPDFVVFQDRPLYRALAGVVSPKVTQDFDKEVKDKKVDLFLPSGSSFQIGDGCRGMDSYIPPRVPPKHAPTILGNLLRHGQRFLSILKK